MAPAAEGVRARRAFIASMIDRATQARRDLRILSIAAGHLREANLCAAVRRKRFDRFVALDSDADSLAKVRESYGVFGVETVLANVRRLIAGKLSLGEFDLVYSTGLFDYVGPAAGRRLVRNMFQHLRSGGRLLVANFLPGIRDAAYMETFMDWQLIYRTRHEMIDLTMEIPQDEIHDISLFTEENRNIIFVQVRRS
jgi:SAM-dependent methyltransferase